MAERKPKVADPSTSGQPDEVEAAPPSTSGQSKGAPRFGMCEGTREEIERTGTAVDPFTGATLTRDDLP